LYAVGTGQGFRDSTQLSLLGLTTVLGVLLVVASVYGIIMDGCFLIRRKRVRFLLGALGYLFLGFLGTVAALGAALIMVIAGGNR
jgi:O-antigen ligase